MFYFSPEQSPLTEATQRALIWAISEKLRRHALKAKMLELGYDIDGKELDDLFSCFKSVAGNKKIITDDDLIALVSDEVFQPQVIWKLEDVQVTCGTLGLSTATIKLIDASGNEHIACSTEMSNSLKMSLMLAEMSNNLKMLE